MNIWNKVLLGLTILVSLGVFYFALQTLHIHRTWRASAQKHEKKLQEVSEENTMLLEEGLDGKGGIRALDIELSAEYAGRGRVWYDCKPYDIKDLEAKVLVPQPNPHHIRKHQVVYVFDCLSEETMPDNAGDFSVNAKAVSTIPKVRLARFLGEFDVEKVAPGAIKLKPTMTVSPEMEDRINKSVNRIKGEKKGGWMIWEQMPADSHDLFASLSEEELRSLLPEMVVNEYLENGGKDRKLRDYLSYLKWYDQIRTNQKLTKLTLTRYNAALQEALDEVKRQKKLSDNFNTELKRELAKVEAERDAVLAYEKSLKQEIRRLTQAINELMDRNRVLAQSLQQVEEQAMMEINSRTASFP